MLTECDWTVTYADCQLSTLDLVLKLSHADRGLVSTLTREKVTDATGSDPTVFWLGRIRTLCCHAKWVTTFTYKYYVCDKCNTPSPYPFQAVEVGSYESDLTPVPLALRGSAPFQEVFQRFWDWHGTDPLRTMLDGTVVFDLIDRAVKEAEGFMLERERFITGKGGA